MCTTNTAPTAWQRFFFNAKSTIVVASPIDLVVSIAKIQLLKLA